MDHPPPASFRNGRVRYEVTDPDVDFDSRPDENHPAPDLAATTARDVWLTFDDGPDPLTTPKVLAALSGADLKATFFMLGVKVEAQPRLVEQVFEAGHRIGNHSYSHRHLNELPEVEIREEIARTDILLAPYLGAEKLFRPPFGHTSGLVQKVAAELGYRQMLWTVDPRDWDKNYKPKKWMDFGISQMKALSSCVVLLHDVQPTTSSGVAAFIAMIRQLAGATFKAPSTL